MKRRHHYRRLAKDPAELDMTTFLNLMVVLVPFLLITAVFSRITIVELSLPSSASGATAPDRAFSVEVIVREEGLELGNGSAVIARIPKSDGAYDLGTLGDYVKSLKRDHPEQEQASVLLEPQIEYDHLIQVMDVVRSAPLPQADAEGNTRLALFPDISIGDAP